MCKALARFLNNLFCGAGIFFAIYAAYFLIMGVRAEVTKFSIFIVIVVSIMGAWLLDKAREE